MVESEKSKKWRKNNLNACKNYMRRYRRIGIEDIKQMLRDPDEIWFERDARKLKNLQLATPLWVDKNAIRSIYQRAIDETMRYGIEFTVIHIYPVKHKSFSGLHVANNLKIVSLSYKKRMGRKFNKNYL